MTKPSSSCASPHTEDANDNVQSLSRVSTPLTPLDCNTSDALSIDSMSAQLPEDPTPRYAHLPESPSFLDFDLDAKAYLDKSVFPHLLPALETLLRELKKGDGSFDVTTGKVKFANPLDWLAKHLYTQNDKRVEGSTSEIMQEYIKQVEAEQKYWAGQRTADSTRRSSRQSHASHASPSVVVENVN